MQEGHKADAALHRDIFWHMKTNNAHLSNEIRVFVSCISVVLLVYRRYERDTKKSGAGKIFIVQVYVVNNVEMFQNLSI